MGIKARKIGNSNAPILQFNLTINIVFSRIGPKQTTVNKISIKYEIIYWDKNIFMYKIEQLGEYAIRSSQFYAHRFNLFVSG